MLLCACLSISTTDIPPTIPLNLCVAPGTYREYMLYEPLYYVICLRGLDHISIKTYYIHSCATR